jgi:hypothetical protein
MLDLMAAQVPRETPERDCSFVISRVGGTRLILDESPASNDGMPARSEHDQAPDHR